MMGALFYNVTMFCLTTVVMALTLFALCLIWDATFRRPK